MKCISVRSSARFIFASAVLCLILYATIKVYNENSLKLVLNLHDGNISGNCCRLSSVTLNLCGFPNCVKCHVKTAEVQISAEGSNVFFHETSYSTKLDVRQACAVESAAFLNPGLTVHLLTTGQLEDTSLTGALRQYRNVRIERITLGEYFFDTPLEQWYFCSKRLSGPYVVSHLSDALRFLTLFKYGGFYFDLDIVMLKPLDSMRNFIGAESDKHLAVGAMHFDKSHPLIQRAVADFAANYKLDDWGANGPRLMTRVLQDWCGIEDIRCMWTSTCPNVTVYSPQHFYPIHWSNWDRYFAEERSLDFPAILEGAITAHLWNKFSHQTSVRTNSTQIYAKIASRFCPKTNSVAGDSF